MPTDSRAIVHMVRVPAMMADSTARAMPVYSKSAGRAQTIPNIAKTKYAQNKGFAMTTILPRLGAAFHTLTVLILLGFSSPAFAQYQEVNGTPRVTVAGRTLGVWAAENPIGDILGIFERGPDGVWRGLCLASPGYPTLDEAVKSAGGPPQYVDSQLARLNTCLSQAFGVSFDDTARGRINAALAQYFTLTPQPALARK